LTWRSGIAERDAPTDVGAVCRLAPIRRQRGRVFDARELPRRNADLAQ